MKSKLFKKLSIVVAAALIATLLVGFTAPAEPTDVYATSAEQYMTSVECVDVYGGQCCDDAAPFGMGALRGCICKGHGAYYYWWSCFCWW